MFLGEVHRAFCIDKMPQSAPSIGISSALNFYIPIISVQGVPQKSSKMPTGRRVSRLSPGEHVPRVSDRNCFNIVDIVDDSICVTKVRPQVRSYSVCGRPSTLSLKGFSRMCVCVKLIDCTSPYPLWSEPFGVDSPDTRCFVQNHPYRFPVYLSCRCCQDRFICLQLLTSYELLNRSQTTEGCS